ncbi:retrovirus-related pol polyprotein from transposon TNT 1-94 [Tanacetum coccineum]
MTHRNIQEHSVNVVTNDDMTSYGIRGLGHISEKGMSILSKKNVLSDWRTYMIVVGINREETKEPVLMSLSSFIALVERQTENNLNVFDQTMFACSFWGEALKRVQLINLTPCVPWRVDVPDKASVNIPKDERSKLDVKGKPCVFLEYSQDEFRYKLYDPVQKKLVRSRDVVFEEYLTLKDVEKAERETIPQHNIDLIDLDPVPPKHFDSHLANNLNMKTFNMDKAKVVSSPLTTNFKLTDKDCPSSKKKIEKMDRVPMRHIGAMSILVRSIGKLFKWIFRYCEAYINLGITLEMVKP